MQAARGNKENNPGSLRDYQAREAGTYRLHRGRTRKRTCLGGVSHKSPHERTCQNESSAHHHRRQPESYQHCGYAYPGISRQRFWVYKMRNVATYLPRIDRDECTKEAQTIYNVTSRQKAIEHYFLWAKKWRLRRPKAVACIEKDLEKLLVFYGTLKVLWNKLRTTNVI